MPTFAYKVADQGRRRSGRLDAGGVEEAVRTLRAQSLVVLDLKPAEAHDEPSGGPAPRAPWWSRRLAGLMTSGRKREVALHQLAALLDAGVPVMTALEVVASQSPRHLNRAFEGMSARIREGASFCEAFAHEAPWFGDVTLGMLRIGESNGQLPRMLRDSSRWMERARQIRSRLLEALSYPAVVVLLATGVGYFLVSQVIPKILAFITSNGRSATLPESTQLLMRLTEIIQRHGPLFMMTVLLCVLSLFLARRHPIARRRVDAWSLRLPVVGPALVASSNAIWCRTLGLLLQTGIPVLEALELVRTGTVNGHYRHQLAQVREHILEGQSLGEALQRTDLARLCPLATAMITVGEGSGTVDDSMIQAADYSEEDLVLRIDLLSKLIEPAIYIVVGVMVGFVYYSFFAATQAVTRSLT